MSVDDIKVFAKNEKRIWDSNTGSENGQSRHKNDFNLEKRSKLIMRSEKQHMAERIELSSQEKIRTLGEKKTYKYLGILDADTIKQEELKKKIPHENEKIFRNQTIEKKSHQRDIHSWPFIKWTREKRQQMN